LRLEYSDGADKDIDEIRAWLLERSPESAQRFTDGLLGRIRQIALFPGSGRIPEGQRHTRIREVVEGNYIICYAVGAETVTILCVVHAARDR
jgi:plasmid stabilization system protein ParE